MIDVETDGPIPGTDAYSMIEIGAVLVTTPLKTAPTFYGRMKPISPRYDLAALKVSNKTREQTLNFDEPAKVMRDFADWVHAHNKGKRPYFISDNNGFDYMFTAWYLYYFVGICEFVHTSTNLGSLYKGLVKDTFKNFKKLRVTPHTHYPVDDAMGNAEALVYMRDNMGLNILLE